MLLRINRMEDSSNFRLQKISMIVADVLLVLFAVFFAFSGEGPMNPVQFFLVIICVTVGGVLAFIPFYLEYKVKANLAEYDRTQANEDNARRIEHALAEIQEMASGVTQHADRAEQMATKFEGLMGNLDGKLLKDQEAQAKLAKDKQDMAKAMDDLREELKKSIADAPSAEDTAALIGGIEVQLGNLSSQVEQFQFELARRAVSEKPDETAIDDLTPQTATEEDEAVEPSTFIDDEAETPDFLEKDEKDDEQEFSSLVFTDSRADSPEEKPEETEGESAEAVVDDLPEEATEESDEAVSESNDILEIDEPGGEEVALDDLEPEEPSVEDVQPETAAEPEPDEETEMTKVAETVESEPEAAVADADDDEPEEAGDDEAGQLKAGLSDAKLEELDEFGDIDISAPALEEVTTEAPDSPEAVAEEKAEEPAQPDLMADLPPATKKKRAKKSAKDATTLVAQVLIGIGNKPYVRGSGPGLSEEEGVAMEFVEIGKWQWIAPDGDSPVTCRIYKNDEVPADGEAIELEPGQRRTVTPSFPA